MTDKLLNQIIAWWNAIVGLCVGFWNWLIDGQNAGALGAILTFIGIIVATVVSIVIYRKQTSNAKKKKDASEQEDTLKSLEESDEQAQIAKKNGDTKKMEEILLEMDIRSEKTTRLKAELAFSLGLLFLYMDNYRKAREYFHQAHSCQPGNPDYCNRYGGALIIMGYEEDGLKLIALARKIRQTRNITNAQPLYFFAWWADVSQHTKEFIILGGILLVIIISIALRGKRGFAISIQQYEAMLKQREWELSSQLQAALDNPDERRILEAELASVRGKLGKLEPAYYEAMKLREEAFNILSGLKNELFEDWLDDAYKAIKKGDIDTAEKLYEEAQAKEDPILQLSAKAAFELGVMAEERQEYESAEIYFRRAAALEPDNGEYLTSAGDITHLTGKYYEAEEFHKRAMNIRIKTLGENHPHVVLALRNLATVYESTNRGEEAGKLRMRIARIQARMADNSGK